MAVQWTEDEAMRKEVSQNLMYTVMHINKKLLHADQLSEQFGMPMSSIQLIFALANGEQTVSQLADYLAIRESARRHRICGKKNKHSRPQKNICPSPRKGRKTLSGNPGCNLQ